MYTEIERELKFLKRNLNSGYVKFGIERSEIVSITISSNLDKTEYELTKNSQNPEERFEKFCKDHETYFGTFEFILELGEIKSFNFCETLKGQHLQAVLLKHKKQEEKNADL